MKEKSPLKLFPPAPLVMSECLCCFEYSVQIASKQEMK
ncbi:hypothetical protein BSBH6_01832 [Bacillus subtilis]|nr:hypothetical protein BSBH6_01832 [Bacillus subtilis]RPK25445.1 hypothetical protein BH5_02277 [Bacillus subtilis]